MGRPQAIGNVPMAATGLSFIGQSGWLKARHESQCGSSHSGHSVSPARMPQNTQCFWPSSNGS